MTPIIAFARRTPGWMPIRIFLLLLISAITLSGQRPASPGIQGEEADPAALIQRASANEVAALQSPDYFRYLETLEWKWGTETREVIETPQGRADRIVEFNGEPLSPDQSSKQEERLRKLLRNRDAVRHEIADQEAEVKRRINMMQAFPLAFKFTPEGEQDGLLRFSFRPNGSFSPEGRQTQVYRGMQGKVWVEPKQRRLVRIDGTLTRNVSFGWGIFGKLYKGGHYRIEQTQVKPGIWRITTLDLDLKIRVLFNTSHLLRNERNSEFRATPPATTYQEALQILLGLPERPAHINSESNHGPAHPTEQSK
ncbi:MAG TPA: hypothetical protein VFP59_01605 [Candidatus Angelobacter sp.]|nr:hypothetical protein [Candidatus Angelobacter sp.]